jgi:cardiolipin synthase
MAFMGIEWKELLPWQIITIASGGYVLLQFIALLSAMHSLRHVRTSQAAVGWAVGLFLLPFLTLPLYWIFARNRFEGYRDALRQVDDRHHRSVHAVHHELVTEAHEPRVRRLTALERVADVLNTPISHGNQYKLLVDGDAFLESMLETIQSAQRYIYLCFYIVQDDQTGKQIADALIERAAAGVKVRLVYDEVGCLRISYAYFRRLTEAGIEVHSFNTRQGWVNRFQINFRNHRKLMVVDGEQSIVGGLNIGDSYIGESVGREKCRDSAVWMSGPVSRKVQAVFAGDYYWAARHDLPEADWDGPTIDPRVPLDRLHSGAAVCATGPADSRPRATMMFAAVAAAARQRLWICTPYLVPDETTMSALHMAKARGVHVRVLIPYQADPWAADLAAFHYEWELYEAGIPVYRYEKAFMHQKCVLVDDTLALVGSTNMDNRSLYLNFELMMAIEDPYFVADVAAMMEKDFQASTLSNTPDAPARRWWIARFGTAVARLFSPIL